MNRVVLTGVVLLAVIAISVAKEDENSTEMVSMEEDTSEERKKKNGMAQLYMSVMMVKSIIGTALNALNTLVEVKSFGLSVIGTLISLVNIILKLKEHFQKNSGGGYESGGGHEDWRRVATPAPPVHWRRPPINYYK
ncbi:uncharacterized protein LOC106664190 [Cimex lectularius]|uniref:Uncharacterized protein n=1 Tax=Cimex lectularius TaxID=79782 RepID=A0A8I6RGN8_CIMLE|nr:uncharacterized protein LOC106664190 [Cimex lectularius]XP_014245132.1 uncharacterized protein LOC106664190 [Cimex lectularius]XP_014245133.1 uncharacterized protein LOC106664190 [Cimex lectularius]XP_014245134.1 uncharacterized protein LOC106664190 [Cimex lectularius]